MASKSANAGVLPNYWLTSASIQGWKSLRPAWEAGESFDLSGVSLQSGFSRPELQ